MNDSARKKGKQESKLKGYDNIFATRLRELMEQTKTTQGTLAKESGCSRQAISQYMDGSSMPNVDKLLSIADYFDVSIDYLLGREDKKNEKELQHIVSGYTGLSEEAIHCLRYSVTTWQKSNPPKDTLLIFNRFVEDGQFSLLAEAMTDYYEEVIHATNEIESAVCTLKEEYDKRDGTQSLDVFELSNFTKELRLNTFDIQTIAVAFMQKYAKNEFNEYHNAVEKLRKANWKNNEYNIEVIDKEKERRKKAGVEDGNNQETQ